MNARAILAVVAASPAVFTPSAHASPCAGVDTVPTAATVGRARAAALCLVNVQRRRHRERPLRTSAVLQLSAGAYANTMVRERFFSHVTPSGLTFQQRIRRESHYLDGAWSWRVGENLGWGIGRLATPAGMVKAWMASAAHRRILLDGGFREMGMGIAPGAPVAIDSSTPTATYVNQFGRRG